MRAAGLDETQVLGRDVRIECQLELAEAPTRAPEANQLAGGQRLVLGRNAHPSHGSEPRARRDLID
jgi:hypothetical protein